MLPLQLLLSLKMYYTHSLVPRRPDLFNCTREKRGSLVKLITCVTSGGTDFHIWHNSKLAGLRHRISHRKFELLDLNVTIGYKSARGDASASLLCVKNCDLRGNSVVSTLRWNRLRRWHDRVYHANRGF